MKIRILYVMVFLTAIVNNVMAQRLSIASIEGWSGEQSEVVVNLSEGTNMTALQFNISLPDGVYLTQWDKRGNHKFDITLGTAVGDHKLCVCPLLSGELLVVLYSMTQETFNDGELLRIPVTIGNKAGITQGLIHSTRGATPDIVSKECDGTSFSVTVHTLTVDISAISLDQELVSLTEGETLTLVATVAPDDATDKTVTWSSSNTSVATVVDGVVTAIAPGTATITATAGDYSATCVVTVESKVVDGIDNSEIINHKSEIIYDLMGRRVTQPQKGGVYIVNGQKVIF